MGLTRYPHVLITSSRQCGNCLKIINKKDLSDCEDTKYNLGLLSELSGRLYLAQRRSREVSNRTQAG
jgi:hypothetical protein